MKYIDLHTHKLKNDEHIEVLNVFAHELDKVKNPCCVGFHPWHIDQYDEREQINLIHDNAERPEIIAIGECGIDRAIATDIEIQRRIFLKQAGICENKNKPLIIHCVKAYNDIIELKKSFNSDIPWILHAYQANLQTTKQLLKHGFYFSFGHVLLNPLKKISDSLKVIPLDKLFFETDENEIPIEKIYSFAAKIIKVDIETLKSTVYENFKRVFNYG